MLPDRFDPLLSSIVVAPAGSFISQSATTVVAAAEESAKALAPPTNTAPISSDLRQGTDDPWKKRILRKTPVAHGTNERPPRQTKWRGEIAGRFRATLTAEFVAPRAGRP
jgi:hypothetical protein